ncbi:hypothetical protein DFH09DRAFT_877301, partial [Mycena vulgaris]
GQVACPNDAAQWFRLVFAEVSQEEVGGRYQELLTAFVELERAYGFENGPGVLAKKGRPLQVSDWIGRGRKKGPRAIPKVEKFEVQWWAWWRSIQPAWRKVGVDGRPLRGEGEVYGEDWGGLVLPGQNGVLSVVATLYW